MRRLVPVLLAATLLAPASPAAPVPKHLMNAAPVCYYPTAVGATWVYESSGNEWVYVVTRVERSGGTKLVTVEWDLGKNARGVDEVVAVSASGLARTQSGAVKLTEPDVYLKQPFKTGDTWDFDNPGAKGKDDKGTEVTVAPFKGTARVAGVETVKVPAGTFEAVRVDVQATLTCDGKEVKWEASTWYAPNVGRVKVTGEGGRVISQLKSFTPGKE